MGSRAAHSRYRRRELTFAQQRRARARDLRGARRVVDAPAGKPDPRAFHGALDRFGTHPDEALMIGTNIEEDVRGAVRAGLQAILADRHARYAGVDVRTVTRLDEVHFGPVGSPG